MGQDWRPNKAIPVELLLLLLELAKLKIQRAVSFRDKNWCVVFHTYVAVCYMFSLPGCEGFLLDLAQLNHKFMAGGNKYVVLALLGQIKGESGNRAPLIQCIPMTSSGIDVRASVTRLIKFKQARATPTDRPSLICQETFCHIKL
jgi:hypothetical protein